MNQSDETETVTDAAVVAELARVATVPQLLKSEEGREFLLSHKDIAVSDVSDQHGLFLHKPSYIKQGVLLQTTVSLVDYVNRFKLLETTVFADISKDRMEAIIDYHGAPGPDHKAHRAFFALQKSQEWLAWTGFAQGVVGQLPFARFLEENAMDVSTPDAGSLLDVIRDLHALRKVRFDKAVRTPSNNEDFQYTVENEAKTKGGVELPHSFELRIPVYFDEPPIFIKAFLRWEINPEEGGLKLGIKLHRPEYVRQAEFQRIAFDISEKTDRPVIYGNVMEPPPDQKR